MYRRCEVCGEDFIAEPEFECINLCYKHFPSTWKRVWDKIKRFCNRLSGKENKPSIFFPEIREQVFPHTLNEEEVENLGKGGADDR